MYTSIAVLYYSLHYTTLRIITVFYTTISTTATLTLDYIHTSRDTVTDDITVRHTHTHHYHYCCTHTHTHSHTLLHTVLYYCCHTYTVVIYCTTHTLTVIYCTSFTLTHRVVLYCITVTVCTLQQHYCLIITHHSILIHCHRCTLDGCTLYSSLSLMYQVRVCSCE